MRVHHLDCGTMRPLGGRFVGGAGGPFGRAEMVCHCLLIETRAGLVLVETGIGTPAVRNAAGWLGAGFVTMMKPDTHSAGSAVHQVKALGHTVEDVRHVVLTHLDLDHAGGLVDFPHATVHVYARELDSFLSPRDARERKRYRAGQFAHDPRWNPYSEHGEPWFGFEAVRELDGLPPEILLVPLAGHTRGHAGVAVDTGSGWLLHAGDSYFHRGTVETGARPGPPLLRGFETLVQAEKHARLANQRRLRELVREHGEEVTVFSAHDAVEFRRLRDGAPAR